MAVRVGSHECGHVAAHVEESRGVLRLLVQEEGWALDRGAAIVRVRQYLSGVATLELALQIGSVRREMRLVIVGGLRWRPMQVLVAPLGGLRHREGALMPHHLLRT